jgi:hypothetical protein
VVRCGVAAAPTEAGSAASIPRSCGRAHRGQTIAGSLPALTTRAYRPHPTSAAGYARLAVACSNCRSNSRFGSTITVRQRPANESPDVSDDRRLSVESGGFDSQDSAQPGRRGVRSLCPCSNKTRLSHGDSRETRAARTQPRTNLVRRSVPLPMETSGVRGPPYRRPIRLAVAVAAHDHVVTNEADPWPVRPMIPSNQTEALVRARAVRRSIRASQRSLETKPSLDRLSCVDEPANPARWR